MKVLVNNILLLTFSQVLRLQLPPVKLSSQVQHLVLGSQNTTWSEQAEMPGQVEMGDISTVATLTVLLSIATRVFIALVSKHLHWLKRCKCLLANWMSAASSILQLDLILIVWTFIIFHISLRVKDHNEEWLVEGAMINDRWPATALFCKIHWWEATKAISVFLLILKS